MIMWGVLRMPESGRSIDRDMIRRKVVFAGRVQGVGFRYTTCGIARGFDVSGYVKNLPDGRVEMVAEGTREELAQFVAAIRSEMHRNISDAAEMERAATGEFQGFGVRH